MQDYKKLKVWQRAYSLCLSSYQITEPFPAGLKFGLAEQIRRAALSIPLNIAEGCGRGTDADFKHFIQIAFGSACELECCLSLAKDLKVLAEDKQSALDLELTEIKRMLS